MIIMTEWHAEGDKGNEGVTPFIVMTLASERLIDLPSNVFNWGCLAMIGVRRLAIYLPLVLIVWMPLNIKRKVCLTAADDSANA
jgi:hypothetical protein